MREKRKTHIKNSTEQGHAVTLTFKVSNVIHDTLSQYGDNLCKVVKSPTDGADSILLQRHAVTLTFEVATEMCVHIVHIASDARTKLKKGKPSGNKA